MATVSVQRNLGENFSSTSNLIMQADLKHVASPASEGFTNIALDENVAREYSKENPENPPVRKKKQPRRILHFSDGILEEYSTDEEDDIDNEAPPPVDPKTLTWMPWIWYKTVHTAATVLGAADFCGEKLAWFFGITSPKYQSAIDEYYRMKAQDEADKAEEYEEESGREFVEPQSEVTRSTASQHVPDVMIKNNPHNTQHTTIEERY